MATETLTIDFRRPMPVFPLQDCVLLPHTLLPLHIFEPRYVQMVQDTLDDIGLLAMGLFRQQVPQQEYLHGRPALRPFVCLGQVRQYEPMVGGRFLLVLQGICRARIVEEVPHDPYRTFRLQPFAAGDDSSEDDLQNYRQGVETLLGDPVMEQIPLLKELHELQAELSTTALIDATTAAICADAEQRYRLLKEPNPSVRAEWLLNRLQDILTGFSGGMN